MVEIRLERTAGGDAADDDCLRYTFVSLTVVLDGESVEETVRGIAENRAFFRAHAEQFILVESVDDVLRAKREGKLAVGFNFQGTESIGRDINLVEVYCKLGVRQMLMAYTQGNAVGGGCHERVDAGLTRFGVELVQEMNRVGVLVDVSHTGYRTSMDVFEVSPGPVIFSHSNPYALFEHGRNIRDDQIKACARSGGVIGIVGCDQFMVDAGPTTEGLLNMIDYHAEVAGRTAVRWHRTRLSLRSARLAARACADSNEPFTLSS